MRVAIVSGVVVRHDAISAAVCDQAQRAADVPGVESVTVFAQHIDRELSCPGFVISDPWSLISHPEFRDCDVAIFHWGIHYALFDAITVLVGESGPRPAVHFHNCSPRELVSPEHRNVIDASERQIDHVVGLDVGLWTYSEFNRRTLRALGAPAEQIRFVPFSIEVPSPASLTRRSNRVELITVGRRVHAKGLHVLVDAIGLLEPDVRSHVLLRVVGSALFSDPSYEARIAGMITDLGLTDTIQFVDDPLDAALFDLFATSDIVVSPSMHEGLCVPIIEGYASGCRAIGTTGGNLPFLVQPPDPCVEPGNAAQLAAAITSMVPEIDTQRVRGVLHPELVAKYSTRSTRRALQLELYRLMGR